MQGGARLVVQDTRTSLPRRRTFMCCPAGAMSTSARLHQLALLGLAHGQRAARVQALGQRAREAHRHVLHHEHRRSQVLRQAGMIACSAGGPPVEVPITTTSVRLAGRGGRPAQRRGPRRRRPRRAAPGQGAHLATAAPPPGPAGSCGPWTLDLSTKSSAPSSRPRSVTSAPSLVSEESSSTGTGYSAMMRSQGLEAAHPRHLDVEGHDVGLQGAGPSRAPSLAVGRGAHDLDVGRAAEHARQGLAHEGRVVDDQHADHGPRASVLVLRLLVDHRALEADGGEEVGDAGQRLRVAEEQVAPGASGSWKSRTTRRIMASEK